MPQYIDDPELLAQLNDGGAPKKYVTDKLLLASLNGSSKNSGDTNLFDSYLNMNKNAVKGVASGFADVGNTILNAAVGGGEYLKNKMTSPSMSELVSGQRSPSAIKQWNDERAATLAEDNARNAKDSRMFSLGRIGGNIAATYPLGGIVGAGAKALGAERLGSAIASGGFRTGAPVTAGIQGMAADLGIRSLGGGINGLVSAGAINPDQAGSGAVIGAALPPALRIAGGIGKYAGNIANSLISPLTESGQKKFAQQLIDKFAAGGPTALNTTEYVPGSIPTLAEATGNPGIARMQATLSDLPDNVNRFSGRQTANAQARNTAFDNIAGDQSQLDFYKADRSAVGKQLYDAALNRSPEASTPYMKGQVTQLLKRPSINDASRVAQKWALERGEKPYLEGSLPALHDVKTALDDKIAAAVQSGQGGEVKALQATQAKLLDVMEKMSPEYADARNTYAAMSKPVNEMEALQGLKVTDANGNITLSKIQNAISGLESSRNAPGFNNAKSIADDKLKSLYAIRDDLLRKSNLNSGKSAGSNTFQNLATNNILESLLPGKVGNFINPKINTPFARVGNLIYGGANQKIMGNLSDIAFDPSNYAPIMNQPKMQGLLGNGLDYLTPGLYRSAPLLWNGQ